MWRLYKKKFAHRYLDGYLINITLLEIKNALAYQLI
jgi:hypothetical protein